jgi:hypothetical protein
MALIFVAVLPAPAHGAADELSDDPSLNQYVESVPTARGNRPPSERGGRRGGEELPPEVRRELREQGGELADDLAAAAGDPSAGAPPARPKGRRDASPSGWTAYAPADEPGPSLPSAATNAVGDGTRLPWLLAALAALALVAVLTAARRRAADGPR